MMAAARESAHLATARTAGLAQVGRGDRPTALRTVQEGVAACEQCVRLRTYCQRVALEKKAAHRGDTYWGRPVPGFGDPEARLLIVGLAPAAHGANRTGRLFTGDGSGDFLMRSLHDAGFATIPTARHAGDGLALRDAYILSVVRCAPPDNKPTPDEVLRCRVHLRAEVAALPQVRVVVALGKIAWDGYLAYQREQVGTGGGRRNAISATGPGGGGVRVVPAASSGRAIPRPAFAHGAVFPLGRDLPTLVGSYHPSRQNTNTGRLTPAMLDDVFATVRRLLEQQTRDMDEHER